MREAYKNYFPLPNAIFSLNLSPGEIASVITKSGHKRNGSHRYTIRPIQEVVNLYHQRQLRKQDKGLASQVPPAQSHLPAVRAVSRCQHRGQNRKESWHLGSGIPEVPVFQSIYRGQAPKEAQIERK